MILKGIRNGLGWVIRVIDAITRPKPIPRTPEQLQAFDQATQSWSLYQFENCPFCIKVRREIRRLGLRIELRDIRKNPVFEEELVRCGGELQGPCLRLPGQGSDSERWMYESSEIISFLQSRF